MALYVHTYHSWRTIEEVMADIKKRNRRRRILDDSLLIKIVGRDPLLVWDSESGRRIYISKQDWRNASPAITRIEASVILRIKPSKFSDISNALGIHHKKGKVDVPNPMPQQHPKVYYSLDDLYDVSIELENRRAGDAPSVIEIRRLFNKGYVPYKRTEHGQIVPVWDEQIIT